MALPIIPKANDQSFVLMQTQWKSQLDPIIANPLLDGVHVKNVSLNVGDNQINIRLDRMMQGWFLTDQDAAASIYRSQPINSSTLTLFSDAAVKVSLWIF